MLGWKLKILIAIWKVFPAYKTTLFYVGRRKLLKNAKINEGAKSRTKSLTVQDIANIVELKFILGYASYSYHTLWIGWWWEENKKEMSNLNQAFKHHHKNLPCIQYSVMISIEIVWYPVQNGVFTAIKVSLSYNIYYPNLNIPYFWHSR